MKKPWIWLPLVLLLALPVILFLVRENPGFQSKDEKYRSSVNRYRKTHPADLTAADAAQADEAVSFYSYLENLEFTFPVYDPDNENYTVSLSINSPSKQDYVRTVFNDPDLICKSLSFPSLTEPEPVDGTKEERRALIRALNRYMAKNPENILFCDHHKVILLDRGIQLFLIMQDFSGSETVKLSSPLLTRENEEWFRSTIYDSENLCFTYFCTFDNEHAVLTAESDWDFSKTSKYQEIVDSNVSFVPVEQIQPSDLAYRSMKVTLINDSDAEITFPDKEWITLEYEKDGVWYPVPPRCQNADVYPPVGAYDYSNRGPVIKAHSSGTIELKGFERYATLIPGHYRAYYNVVYGPLYGVVEFDVR
ncbi:immunoglobulin-like domain-containing protein [Anaerolentibacter hominis]|uniref:immunoglobulin-like domain-containing protein n=1 Tax=Anaerolentibacter hominis TaxID=3079009 RepID=UPI0031B80EE5